MSGHTWELQDPVVSQWVVIPTFKVFQVELWKHGGLLWSNLRALGLPTLGNSVQAAPLFPLTLLFCWLPDHLFWNAFVIARMFLLGMGAFLIAQTAMKLDRLPSALFALCFSYALNVLRWANHPYQNGLLAGVFCLLWTVQALQDQSPSWTRTRALRLLGLALASYSLFTCGFPEAIALSGLLVLFVALPFIWKSKALGLVEPCGGLAIGAAVAAPQIIALVEYVHSAPPDLRAGIGTYQFPMAGFAAFFLEKLTLLGGNPPAPPEIHAFNLIPLVFFLLGIAAALRRPAWSAGALLCVAFYVFKVFPLWPGLNHFVGSLPVLVSCWFTSYFFPLLLWGFAYFVAAGAQAVCEEPDKRARVVIAWSSILLLVAYALRARRGISLPVDSKSVQLLLLYLAFLALMLAAFARGHRWWRLAVFAVALTELCVVRPPLFRHLSAAKEDYFSDPKAERVIIEAAQRAGVKAVDTRLMDTSAANDGRFVAAGFASPDDGAPPLLPSRLLQLREALFETEQGGLRLLTRSRYPYSWSVIGTRLFLTDDRRGFPGTPPAALQSLAVIGKAQLAFDPSALPRAYLASRCVFVESPQAARAILVDPKRFSPGLAAVETASSEETALCAKIGGRPSSVPIEEDKGSKVTLGAVRGPGLLVLDDVIYPGWRAVDELSGSELPIRAANLAFRGIFLPEARDYRLRFDYRPWWLWPALASSLCGLLSVATVLLLESRFGSLRSRQP
jgi:hypothetical protein